MTDTGTLCEAAQLLHAPPWLTPSFPWKRLGINETTAAALAPFMNISYFAHDNLTMDVTDGNKVSFRYRFNDFRGTTAPFAQWEAFLEMSCQRLENKYDIPLIQVPFNFTDIIKTDMMGLEFRWIYPNYWDPGSPEFVRVLRNETIQLCKFGFGD